jgi:hypothetical protein
MRLRPLTLFVLCSVLVACAGTMTHMTTYRGAARSFSTDYCGQLCWSQHQPKSRDEISGEETCQNAAAAPALGECAATLSAANNFFVDKGKARSEIKQCMLAKSWWLVTAFIVICE